MTSTVWPCVDGAGDGSGTPALVQRCGPISLDEARAATEDWLAIYNEQRTHSAIGHLPPLAFKQRWQQREFPEKTGVG